MTMHIPSATALSTHDTTRIDDIRIRAVRPLITPALLQEWLPAHDVGSQLVERSRREISRVLHGQDDRLLVVVGPCSIHDHDEAMEYARQLQDVGAALRSDLLVIMRVYFEKPRTTIGWKGYINDPHMNGSFAINEGLEMARKLLLDVLALGMPVGTEFLDLLSPQFISDLVSWGAIGARTTESQSHRQLASGLSCPVGFRNGTDGGIKVAADAILAAQATHAFMGMTKMGQCAIFETRGNDDCHLILRGGEKPNYRESDVQATCELLKAAGLREQVMIDVSHANSAKDYRRQLALPSHAEYAKRRLCPVNHTFGGRAVIDERIVGNHLSSSKTFTARRCSLFSSGASITVGRRPGPPVVVRTNVALISARLTSIPRAEASGAS